MVKLSTPAALQKGSSASAMATKSGLSTTAAGGVAGSGITAGGSASIGTAGKGSIKNKTEVERLWMLQAEGLLAVWVI